MTRTSTPPRTTGVTRGLGGRASTKSPPRRQSPPRSRSAPVAKRAQWVTIDPRIKERRAEVLRHQARRRLRVALGLLGAVTLVVAAWFVLHSSLLSARVVTVVGSVHTPKDQVVAAAGLSDHPPLLDVGGSAAARLEQLPWVARASVAREWPDGVRVSIVERTPVAAVALAAPATGWALVDRTGKVLADAAQAPAGMVEVTGTQPPGAPGTTVAGARAALEVATALPRALRGQVAQVAEGPGGSINLHLTSPVTVDLGSTVDLDQKFEDAAAVLAGAPLVAGDVIDVTVPASPVVVPG